MVSVACMQPPIKLSDVGSAIQGGVSLFEHVELWSIGSRLVLLGENGRGKTTLVKLCQASCSRCRYRTA